MTARLLDFAPNAWQAYQGLRAGEISDPLKQALEQLADDPELVRADPHTHRYPLVERKLRQAGEVWGLLVKAPGDTRWLVLWREIAPVIEIGYIGSVPAGSVPGGMAPGGSASGGSASGGSASGGSASGGSASGGSVV